jgi:hypothetical protein
MTTRQRLIELAASYAVKCERLDRNSVHECIEHIAVHPHPDTLLAYYDKTATSTNNGLERLIIATLQRAQQLRMYVK